MTKFTVDDVNIDPISLSGIDDFEDDKLPAPEVTLSARACHGPWPVLYVFLYTVFGFTIRLYFTVVFLCFCSFVFALS